MSRSFLQQSNINLVPSSNLTGISWGPNGGGQYKTWEQVYNALQKSITPVNIFLKGNPLTTQYVIPSGTYDLKNSNFIGLTFASAPNTLILENGCLLKSLDRVIGNVLIYSNSSSGNTIECIQPDLCVTVFEIGSAVSNFGTTPLFTIPPGQLNVLALLGGKTYVGNPASAIVNVPNGSVCLIYAISGAHLTDNIVSGPAGATCVLEHDGAVNFPFPTQSLFSGTLLNVPLGMQGGSGPTSFRPDTSGSFGVPLSIGCTYFDTDLTLPIWWDGTIWIDAAGNPV